MKLSDQTRVLAAYIFAYFCFAIITSFDKDPFPAKCFLVLL